MALISKVFVAAVVAGLAGCGPLGDGVVSTTLKSVAAPLLNGGSEPEVAVTPQGQPALTRAAIEASDAELLLVSLVSRGSVDLMSQMSTRRGANTWISTDGVSVTISNGMVVATRGSGFDLMAAETRAARRSLAGGGTHERVYETLDGLDQIVTDTFTCETVFDKSEVITIVERNHSTTKWKENCENSRVRFTNLYWVTSNGTIVQTRQYVSLDLGYLVFQRL